MSAIFLISLIVPEYNEEQELPSTIEADSRGGRNRDSAVRNRYCLRPVTFRYKHELDPEGIPQFGLIAEQVERVNPDLVVRDADGKINSVRYEAVNAMLLNEFLKEHRKIEKQQATIVELRCTADNQRAINTKQDAAIAQLKSTVARQQKEIGIFTASLKEQASQIQKVIRLRRIEVSKLARPLVANSQ